MSSPTVPQLRVVDIPVFFPMERFRRFRSVAILRTQVLIKCPYVKGQALHLLHSLTLKVSNRNLSLWYFFRGEGSWSVTKDFSHFDQRDPTTVTQNTAKKIGMIEKKQCTVSSGMFTHTSFTAYILYIMYVYKTL